MRPPVNPSTLANVWYDIHLTTKCGTQSATDRGFKWATHGFKNIGVYFNSWRYLHYFISQRRFKTAKVIPFWANAGQKTHFGFELKMRTAIPNGGKILVAFPLERQGVAMFKSDLGHNQDQYMSDSLRVRCQAGTSNLKTRSSKWDELECYLNFYPYGRDRNKRRHYPKTAIELRNL
jgi:hypothetical protein